MAARGNADGNLYQIHRSLSLTDYALAVLDAGRERRYGLGPPVAPVCRQCEWWLAECTCLDEKLAAR